MSRPCVILDASAIIALERVNLLGILKSLPADFLTTPAVMAEIMDPRYRRSAADDSHSALSVISIHAPSTLPRLSRKLGNGEGEVIALALEKGGVPVIDDLKARSEAVEHGLTPARTIDLLEAAESLREISSVAEILVKLKAAGVHLPPR